MTDTNQPAKMEIENLNFMKRELTVNCYLHWILTYAEIPSLSATSRVKLNSHGHQLRNVIISFLKWEMKLSAIDN